MYAFLLLDYYKLSLGPRERFPGSLMTENRGSIGSIYSCSLLDARCSLLTFQQYLNVAILFKNWLCNML